MRHTEPFANDRGTSRGRVRVLVIDDDPLASRALRRVLERAGARVLAEVTSRDGLERARHYSPDVAFVDLMMHQADGVAMIRGLVGMGLGIRPILLSIGKDPESGVAALRAGARGHMRKADMLTCSLPRLLHAVMSGELLCSRSMVSVMVDQLARAPKLGPGYRPVRSPLTSREWEVLDLLCAGLSTETIADEFVVSIETVRTHVKNLMRKLGANSRADLIAQTACLRASE